MELQAVAQAFRAALDAQKADNLLPEHMQNFPDRCCGVTSELLGEYLKSLGHKPDYVYGKRFDSDGIPQAGHAWLEVEGIVYDLTADQFEGEGMPPVYVDAQGEWHQAFECQNRHLAGHPRSAEYYGLERAVLRETLQRANLHGPALD